MTPHDNKEVFATAEFDRWADRESLDGAERLIFERYFDPARKTIEAGTGGGRIVLALRDMGYRNLHGFDFVPGFIERARQRDRNGTITFEVQDATRLPYPDGSFEQGIWLQQILSLIPTSEGRMEAAREAHRILTSGAPAAFSFMSFEARSSSLSYGLYLKYLRLFRMARGSSRSIQSIPWMRLRNKFNWPCLLDRGPYVYWYRATEAYNFLRDAGFEVLGIGCSVQMMERGLFHETPDAFRDHAIRGALYIACRKP
ncbi:MAG: class I SAM-dependent methyltransferase [Phycisphaerae bacterium]|jgi:ubiquinone/menaquinone biosynthesis C-methylase UbiE